MRLVGALYLSYSLWCDFVNRPAIITFTNYKRLGFIGIALGGIIAQVEKLSCLALRNVWLGEF